MKVLSRCLIIFLCFFPAITRGQENFDKNAPTFQEITGRLVKKTVPLREFRLPDDFNPVKVRDERGLIRPKGVKKERGPSYPRFPELPEASKDAVLQREVSGIAQRSIRRAIGLNINGIGNQPLNPPDPTICAGPNHLIQMINGSSGALFKVFNKTGGQVVATTYLDAITGRGGLGDPVCFYDQTADRFVMTEFANSAETGSEGLVFAVSATPDPAGSWYVYYFSTGTLFPDYPKYSVWPDAYYATSNDFANASTYEGSSVWAFDRSAMLAGNPVASVQRYSLGGTYKLFSMIPVKWEGNIPPPSGTGGLIAYMNDNTWSGAASDSIGLLEFRVNFLNSSLTSIINRSSLAVAAYNSAVCSNTAGYCVSQPGTTTRLDAMVERVMNQPIYRNFGTHEGIVMTHVVNKGSSIASPRWYELRKTGANWSVYQQSTYAPADNIHRFMSSVCYDAYGNIGLIYNVSDGTSVFPGVRYTGRRSCDALNTMSYTEEVIVAGGGRNSSGRYGDYNHLVCDPNGTTYWMTAEYNPTSSWSTRISSFTLDNCSSCSIPSSLSTSAVTISSASLRWNAISSALSYSVDYAPAGSGNWINAVAATTDTFVNLTGLSVSTSYDWRVRSNCSADTGLYAQSSFSTLSQCSLPSGLSTTSITVSSAQISWTPDATAISYDLDYQVFGSASWISLAAATTSTSFLLSNLNSNTAYSWRVRTNCNIGTGGYVTSNFSTLIICGTPAGLATGLITGTSASISWQALDGAINYDVDIKPSSSVNWTSVATATTSRSFTVSGLAASTSYDWRVRGNCTSGTGPYATATFLTSVPTAVCLNAYEPNETNPAAATAGLNTLIYAAIGSSTDIDYYKFTLNAPGSLRIKLSNLPADYDLYLYNASNVLLGSSELGGTNSDSINYLNASAGNYFIKVQGYNGALSTTVCYQLMIGFQPFIYNPVVNVKAFIQGYYLGSQSMAPALLNSGLPGLSSETDSIVVELRDEVNGSLKGSNTTVLKTNGNATSNFTGLFGRHYIVMRHRNALETWSSAAIMMDSVISYDFTNAANKAYGNNQAQVGVGVYAVWSGDVNQDGAIESDDYGIMENNILSILFGYFPTDLTGDGAIESSDYSLMENNILRIIFVSKPF